MWRANADLRFEPTTSRRSGMLGRSRRDAVLGHPAWVARPAHTEQSACVTGLPTTSNRSVEREPTLTERQAYEAAYRFVASVLRPRAGCAVHVDARGDGAQSRSLRHERPGVVDGLAEVPSRDPRRRTPPDDWRSLTASTDLPIPRPGVPCRRAGRRELRGSGTRRTAHLACVRPGGRGRLRDLRRADDKDCDRPAPERPDPGHPDAGNASAYAMRLPSGSRMETWRTPLS